MPELPEVETIVSDLNRKIKGDVITDFWSDAPKTLKNITAEKFRKEIVGRKIIGAHRIGKNMFIDLSGGVTMYIHLKMTGHLLVKSYKVHKVESKKGLSPEASGLSPYLEEKVNQYIHHIWYLKSHSVKRISRNVDDRTLHAPRSTFYDKTLEFSDLRKFAKIVLLDTSKIKEYKDIINLGIDAMDAKFSFEKFEEILDKKKKMPIGILLMDQSQIAGIGNIYRSEILFESGVLPERKISDLALLEIKKIYHNIKVVLRRAIKYRGTSDSDYRDTDGAPGGFQKIMKVYNQEKHPCKKCGTIIKRVKFGGRSVFFCEYCQK